jgi:uncharacterized protein (UPF0335 family)
MSITLDNEVKKLTSEYALRYLNLELEMKKIKEDMKALKSEYEEQGLETTVVLKALRMYKTDRKLAPKIDELIAYKDLLAFDDSIVDKIAELEAKN